MKSLSNWRKWGAVATLLCLAAVSVIVWRFTAPVKVNIVAEMNAVPLAVETIPPVIRARPGAMVRVVYRIRNTDASPVVGHGKLEIEPVADSGQMQVFRTACAGLITYQPNQTEDYEVLFRVQAAGFGGTRQMTLRHVFVQASP